MFVEMASLTHWHLIFKYEEMDKLFQAEILSLTIKKNFVNYEMQVGAWQLWI